MANPLWEKRARQLEARVAELEAQDDPQWDGTDFAHPAWWRAERHVGPKCLAKGEQRATERIARFLEGLADGYHFGGALPEEKALRAAAEAILNGAAERTSEE